MISTPKRSKPISSDQRRVARQFLDVVPQLLHGLRAALHSQDAPGGPSTVPQLRCLGTLAEGPRTLGAIAEVHGVSAPSMSRLVDGLVERGLVDRARDPDDRRQVVLTLSPQGDVLRRDLLDWGVDHLAGRLAGLTADELAALEQALVGLDRVEGSHSARARSDR